MVDIEGGFLNFLTSRIRVFTDFTTSSVILGMSYAYMFSGTLIRKTFLFMEVECVNSAFRLLFSRKILKLGLKIKLVFSSSWY